MGPLWSSVCKWLLIPPFDPFISIFDESSAILYIWIGGGGLWPGSPGGPPTAAPDDTPEEALWYTPELV